MDGAGRAMVDFGERPAGTHGISVVHHRNADAKLDLNLLGIPTEAFGFSNDAKALIGVPGWQDVRINIGPSGAVLTISLDRAD